MEFYRTYYGPTQRAFASLDAAGQAALRRDLEALWPAHNRATDGITYIESEYLEVVAVRAECLQCDEVGANKPRLLGSR